MSGFRSALLSAKHLADLPAGQVRLLDASWHMPAEKRNAHGEYLAGHIPGARFFDIDAVSDTSSPYPHMLPTPAAFGAALGALGITRKDSVVVYDTAGLFSAPRAWWMLRAMGHRDIWVLDGGMPAWLSSGGKLETGDLPAPPEAVYVPMPEGRLLRVLTQMQDICRTGSEQVVDARSAGRFNGTEPEPRPGLASGHIPGSLNVPFKECLTPIGTMRPREELIALFSHRGLDPARPVVASCGSGVTACVLALALHECGLTHAAVYDGSWAEWGSLIAEKAEA